MRANEIITETKKKDDIKWLVKLRDGKTKTIWARNRSEAEQKLGTSILIQKGYTIKKAPVTEDERFPDVKTYSPEEIAAKHKVPLEQIVTQLKKGIEIEYEHTKDKAVSTEIALDHLLELPDYYDRLEKMER
jgi:hypothetical protein